MDEPVLSSKGVKSKWADRKDNLSDYDLIFLSASSGVGKTYYLSQSQVLRFSHRIILNLTSIHNDVNTFWNELFLACRDAGWIKVSAANLLADKLSNKVSTLEAIRGITKALNKYSGQYTQGDSLYLIFDNAHFIDNSDLIQKIVYFTQQLNSSIKCIFSSRNQSLYTVFSDTVDKEIQCLKEHDFLLTQFEFNKEISVKLKTILNNSLRVNKQPEKTQSKCSKSQSGKTKCSSLTKALYELVDGHVGLALRCLATDYTQSLMADDSVTRVDVKRFALQAVQSEELHGYFRTLTKPLLNLDWGVLALPRLNRALILRINRVFKQDKELEFYLDHGLFNSIDRVNFTTKPLFRHWLDLNNQTKNESLFALAIDQYRNNDHWQEAIQCAIYLKNWPLTIELVCQAARFFSQRGQYQQARDLINKLPNNQQQPLILSLFENLLDFQQYGHQVAYNHLNALIAEHQSDLINTDLSNDQKQANQRSRELIALLQHHYTYLLAPSQEHEAQLNIIHYPQLFNRDHEFCAWAWHSLAMEQILAGNYLIGLESLLKAIHWAMQSGDAPCALASLAWIVMPCLQQGKLSFGLEYCNKLERWLQEHQLHNISMVSILHRVRIILLREQGNLKSAKHELHLMQAFYTNLDPLNLAYCYWAEFLLLLAQKDYDVARQKLTILEGHTAAHFDGWQLALPKPELLSALLDTLAGSELAMLNWASQFQLTHIDNDEVWLKAADITFQSEVLAYLRIRITLGSDMSLICEQLIEQAELRQDYLLALHGLILQLLNASRQGDELSLTRYRHTLLNRAGILEFRQVYKEYLDDLLPLLLNYQALPSELTGYNKIVPAALNTPQTCEANMLNVAVSKHQVINESKLFASLTHREQQICLLVIEGLSNKEIALRFAISLATVKGHVSNVYNKLGIKRRGQLANIFSDYQ